MLEDIIYERIIRDRKESPDSDTPEVLTLTRETNGYAIWYSSYELGKVCITLNHYWSRNTAIEEAVQIGMELIKSQLLKKTEDTVYNIRKQYITTV